METAGVEPTPPRCKRGAPPRELRPLRLHSADGWSRTTTARGAAFTARGALPCSASAFGATDRIRTGTSRITTSGAAVTPRSPWNGDDRTEPAPSDEPDCEPERPDLRRWTTRARLSPCRVSYAPRQAGSGAGGFRTHDLELMRLARTAAPLPRCVDLAGRSRTCGLRFPKPAGCRLPYDQLEHPRRDSNPRLRVESPASSPCSTTGANGSGGRARTCASRLTVARLPARLHRNEDGRRGSRTPKARRARPFSKRGTAPVAVLPEWPRQASNLQPPG